MIILENKYTFAIYTGCDGTTAYNINLKWCIALLLWQHKQERGLEISLQASKSHKM